MQFNQEAGENRRYQSHRRPDSWTPWDVLVSLFTITGDAVKSIKHGPRTCRDADKVREERQSERARERDREIDR